MLEIKTGSKLEIGQIAQLVVEGNKIVIEKSDGTAPYGIVTNIESNPFLSRDRAWVSIDRALVTTDQYETSEPYPLNANLYVSNGLFTTRRPTEKHPAIAMVVGPPTCAGDREGRAPIDVNLHCLWL